MKFSALETFRISFVVVGDIFLPEKLASFVIRCLPLIPKINCTPILCTSTNNDNTTAVPNVDPRPLMCIPTHTAWGMRPT